VMAFAGPVNMNDRKVLYAIVLDVTESCRQEKKLKLSEEKFQKVFECSPDAIVICREEDFRVVEINLGGLAMLQRPRAEVEGRTLHELNVWGVPGDRARFLEKWRADQVVRDFRTLLCRGDGEQIPVSVSCERLGLADGQHIMAVIRRVTTD